MQISDKDWKTRNQGLNKLQLLIAEARLIKPSIGDLLPTLAQLLVDPNAKIGQTAMAICEQLANAMGPACKSLVRTLFPGCLHALADNKAFVRAAAIQCINSFGKHGGYEEFFESEMIADALKGCSPNLKVELWSWLAERLPAMAPKSISKDELTSMLPQLYAHICDRNVDVRKNANKAVLGIMIHLGYETMVKALDKQKPAFKKGIQAALDKAHQNLPEKPLPKGKQHGPEITEKPRKAVRGVGGVGDGSAGQNAAIANKSRAGASCTTSDKGAGATRKKVDDVYTSPLLAVNNTKEQRLIDEQNMLVLKWTFTQPREEFTEQLRKQMTTANVNKGLMANMFHDDFRNHLKVIESLNEDLPLNSKALVCNLDLILKWLSLRFYDTNLTVLLKSLEYLNAVFQTLVKMEYILTNNEGSVFIPHLVLKFSDPKDAVRHGVRTLLRQILLVYPYTKVFVYVMDGLKSKNARQRTECLNELGLLIENYGLTVCQPSQLVALKEIARHISDLGASVRNAALRCVVQAYFLAGDKVYKLIGQLSNKDRSILDDRIKRAKKTKRPETTAKATPSTGAVLNGCSDVLPAPDKPSPRTFDQPPGSIQLMTHQTQLHMPSGPFGLDPNIIAEIERDWVRADQMEFPERPRIDISVLYEPIKIIPTRDGHQYPQERFDRLIARSRQMQQQSPDYYGGHLNDHNQSGGNNANNSRNWACELPKRDPHLIKIIKAISSSDTMKALAAINELTGIIDSAEKQTLLRDYEELFVQNVLTQLKNQSQVPIAESLVVYQSLLSILYCFFHSKTLGRTLSIACTKNLMAALLNLMADQKNHNGEDGQYNKINGICLKVLDKANFTYLNCALIRLLRETCPGACSPKFTVLLMKCIWRIVKMLPERTNELNYDAIIMEVHEFMSALPSSWWQTRPSDTPLRTVKTIIHNMAEVKGIAIMQHLSQIPMHSELYAYVIKILKNLPPGCDGSSQGTKQQDLYKLDELKSQHPDLDLFMADIERSTNVGDSTNLSQQIAPLKTRTMLNRNGKHANYADIE